MNQTTHINKLLLIASLFTTPVIALQQTTATNLITPSITQQNIDYNNLITRRQLVDLLLNDAVIALKSPTRISHAGLTAKIPDNLEVVASRLLEAYQLEPQRTDLLFSAANALIENKKVDQAIDLYKKIEKLTPDNIDVHSYLAVWQYFKKNTPAYQQEIDKLAELNAHRADDIKRILLTIDHIIKTPLKENPSQQTPSKSAIVTLGYALNPDGSMHDILIQRLQKTLQLARQFPNMPIIVTGGVAQNHKTEGAVMSQWLQQQGVDKSRIIEENYATSTVGNALYTSDILAELGVQHATIISSASHVRRGQALFEIASWQSGPKGITFDTISYADKPLAELATASDSELLSIYRDALRTYGLWSYRSTPLEFR